jgi:chromosome segregation ATPase
MSDELKKDVERLVTEIFSQKEEEAQRAETERALNKSAEAISQLTESLEAKNTELEEVAGTIESLNSKIDELTSELEAAKKETEEKANKLTEAETLIDNMNKDKAAEIRMNELVSVGVALSDKKTQSAKVREMSDEEFASYKEELTSIRAAVEAELAKKPVDSVVVEPTPNTPTVEDANADGDSDDLAPANVDPNLTASAAMNLEVKTDDSFLSKYAELGKAMAAKMKN